MRALLILIVLAVLAGGAVWASAAPEAGLRALRDLDPRKPEGERAERKPERRRTARRVRMSRCPAGLAGCRTARGRIVYVERVDPDGDLHVVIAGGGVTAAGMTAVDVRPGLRPRRDPRIGDEASAAGQVQRGSFGQAQIHAVEFHVRRR